MKNRKSSPRKHPLGLADECAAYAMPRRKVTQADVDKAAQRTEIEQAATNASQLVSDIDNLRGHINYLEGELTTKRGQLNAHLLNHQEAVAKLKDLATVPQPVA